MVSPSKGFISLDFLFSSIPVLLIIANILAYSVFLEARAEKKLENQILFDKLVSASNYVVRIAAAEKSGNGFPEAKIIPNLISTDDFQALEDELSNQLHMHLSIGFSPTAGMCIYRLVVYKPTGEIKKLYFCGE